MYTPPPPQHKFCIKKNVGNSIKHEEYMKCFYSKTVGNSIKREENMKWDFWYLINPPPPEKSEQGNSGDFE